MSDPESIITLVLESPIETLAIQGLDPKKLVPGGLVKILFSNFMSLWIALAIEVAKGVLLPESVIPDRDKLLYSSLHSGVSKNPHYLKYPLTQAYFQIHFH
jgi:hypothetical protein